MTRTWLGRVVVVAALAAATPAVAQEGSGLFNRLDSNKDGFVSEDEVEGERKAFFARLLRQGDKDGDDKLSQEELSAALKDRERSREAPREGQERRPGREAIEAMFDRQDSNADGKLSKDEVPEERRERFQAMLKRLDEDDDQALTKEQFVRGVLAMTQRDGERREGDRRDGDRSDERRSEDRPGRPDGRPGASGPPRPPFGPPALIRALDRDADGEISAEEIKGASESLAKLDKNGDGKLTRDELMPGFAGGRPEGGPPTWIAEFAKRLKDADANGDGKLSQEEAPDRLKQNFDRIDTNSDGQIDEAEVRQMFERMRANFGERRPDGDRPRGDRERDGDRREGARPRDGDRPDGDRERDRPKAEDRPREDRD